MQDGEDTFFAREALQGRLPKYVELLKFKVGASSAAISIRALLASLVGLYVSTFSACACPCSPGCDILLRLWQCWRVCVTVWPPAGV